MLPLARQPCLGFTLIVVLWVLTIFVFLAKRSPELDAKVALGRPMGRHWDQLFVTFAIFMPPPGPIKPTWALKVCGSRVSPKRYPIRRCPVKPKCGSHIINTICFATPRNKFLVTWGALLRCVLVSFGNPCGDFCQHRRNF